MKKTKIMLILLTLFIALILLFLRYGGEWLVAEDNLEEMDHAVIVLLMGSVADRGLGAAELYEQGKGDSILMVRSHMPGAEALEERGISISGDADNSQRILSELGVPEADITILPGDAQSTKDEALAVAEYLEGRPNIDRIVLVTSKYHSQRSKLIFNKALKQLDIEIYSAPTPYDTFHAREWYWDREDIQRVATEYLKLAHFLLLEQFQMR
ncbi:YdcF family protein [Oceanobacillus saliphilus]|uniref:YdcF family protein n=1 Tax=Oceanobacillus saliphilus TaxID=2925834 RepID=UPI00201DE9C4|nr:YdcF family protein [Oceanobacillus saliphilus]